MIDLFQTIPATFDPQIQILSLNYNELTEIGSASFYFHPELLQVDLSNNKLHKIQDRTFEAQRICKILNLSYNRLSYINNSTFRGLNSLEHLDLSHNDFTVLTEFSFENLQSLRKLKLNSNKVSVISANAFSGLKFLINLNLANNELIQVESRPLSLLAGLTQLNLSGNRISGLGPSSFSVLPALTRLDLSANPLQNSHLSGESLVGLASLSSLNISDLNISSLPTTFLLPTSLLTELIIDRTNIGEIRSETFLSLRHLLYLSVSGSSRLVRIDEQALSQSQELRRLRLSETPSLSVLPPGLLSNLSHLTALDVRGCSLRSLTVPNVSQWESLELGGNPWQCDCGLASVYRAGGQLTCHLPPGLTLATANMSHCETMLGGTTLGPNTHIITLTVTVTVVLLLLLIVVGLVGWRYQDRMLYLLSRMGGRKCGQQDSLQAFQDTEEFLHFSYSQQKLPTSPVPVTEL